MYILRIAPHSLLYHEQLPGILLKQFTRHSFRQYTKNYIRFLKI